MSATIYLLTICLPLATILLVFGMRSYAAVQQARIRLANDDAYRLLAEKSAAAQAESAAALASIAANLGDLQARVVAIEKVLKEVE
jgi:hypothetical protein